MEIYTWSSCYARLTSRTGASLLSMSTQRRGSNLSPHPQIIFAPYLARAQNGIVSAVYVVLLHLTCNLYK